MFSSEARTLIISDQFYRAARAVSAEQLAEGAATHSTFRALLLSVVPLHCGNETVLLLGPNRFQLLHAIINPAAFSFLPFFFPPYQFCTILSLSF